MPVQIPLYAALRDRIKETDTLNTFDNTRFWIRMHFGIDEWSLEQIHDSSHCMHMLLWNQFPFRLIFSLAILLRTTCLLHRKPMDAFRLQCGTKWSKLIPSETLWDKVNPNGTRLQGWHRRENIKNLQDPKMASLRKWVLLQRRAGKKIISEKKTPNE